MEVDDVNLNAGGRVPPHESEPLGSQTVVLAGIGASGPFGTNEVTPVVIRERIQTGSEGN